MFCVDDRNQQYDCNTCKENNLQEARGCGLIGAGHAGKGSHLVYKQNDGQFKYEATECPRSTMSRYAMETSIISDWSILGNAPFDYDRISNSLWIRLSALKNELEFFRNDYRSSDNDRSSGKIPEYNNR